MMKKIFEKLKSCYYVWKSFDENHNIYLFVIACTLLEIEKPTIYDIDKIAEQMNLTANMFFNLTEKAEFIQRIKTYFKNKPVYTRDDVRRYLELYEKCFANEKRSDVCSRLHISLVHGKYKMCWFTLIG